MYTCVCGVHTRVSVGLPLFVRVGQSPLVDFLGLPSSIGPPCTPIEKGLFLERFDGKGIRFRTVENFPTFLAHKRSLGSTLINEVKLRSLVVVVFWVSVGTTTNDVTLTDVRKQIFKRRQALPPKEGGPRLFRTEVVVAQKTGTVISSFFGDTFLVVRVVIRLFANRLYGTRGEAPAPSHKLLSGTITIKYSYSVNRQKVPRETSRVEKIM